MKIVDTLPEPLVAPPGSSRWYQHEQVEAQSKDAVRLGRIGDRDLGWSAEIWAEAEDRRLDQETTDAVEFLQQLKKEFE